MKKTLLFTITLVIVLSGCSQKTTVNNSRPVPISNNNTAKDVKNDLPADNDKNTTKNSLKNTPEQKQTNPDWLTYKNEVLGFKVMHPENWEKSYQENSIKTKEMYGESLSFMKVYPGLSNFNELKTKIDCTKNVSGVKTDTSKIIALNNRQWLFCDKDPELASLFSYYTIYPSNNEFLVVMGNSESGTEKSDELRKTAEEILNTFSFVD